MVAATQHIRNPDAGVAPALMCALCVNFGLYGISITLIGATLPAAIKEFSWGYIDVAIVVSAASVGFLAASLVSGFFLRTLGPKKIIIVGLALQSLGLLLYGNHPGVGLAFIAITLVSWGEGSSEVITNVCIVSAERDGRSTLMNLVHSMLPVGAVLGPIFVSLMLAAGYPWQFCFQLLALCYLGMLAFFSVLQFEPTTSPATMSGERARLQLLTRPLLLLLCALGFLYFAVEIGLTTWLSEFFVQTYAVTPAVGAFMLALFWLGLSTGRLVFARLYRGTRHVRLLLVLTLASMLPLLAVLTGLSLPMLMGVVFVLGVTLSSVYPSIIVLVGKCFPEQPGTAIGLVAAAGGLGPLSFLFIIAPIASSYDIATALWAYAFVLMVMALVAVALIRRGVDRGHHLQLESGQEQTPRASKDKLRNA